MQMIERQLAELSVQDVDGRPVRLASLWKERPAALIFLRHFG